MVDDFDGSELRAVGWQYVQKERESKEEKLG